MYKIPDEVKEIMNLFQNSFINRHDELIIEPKNNVYFLLNNILNEFELKCKMIEYISRPSCKGVSAKWQKYFRDRFNIYFGTNFDINDMIEIYTYLGCGVNRKKCEEFIQSGFDLKLLKTAKENIDE